MSRVNIGFFDAAISDWQAGAAQLQNEVIFTRLSGAERGTSGLVIEFELRAFEGHYLAARRDHVLFRQN